MKTIVIQPSYPLETCNLRHTAVLSIGDLQSLSYSRLIHWRFAIFVFILTFVDPLLQKNYIEYYASFSELISSTGNFSVYFQFPQQFVLVQGT